MDESMNMSSREKHWEELDGEGRAERTRQQVKMLQQHVEMLQQQMSKMIVHTHHEGKLVVQLDIERLGMIGGFFPRRINEGEYF